MPTHDTHAKQGTAASLNRILRNKYFIVGITLFVVYTLVGFFLVPYLIRQNVPKVIETQLDGRIARIGKVRLNPFLFALEVNHFRLFEQDGTPIVRFDRLTVDFETSSLFRWAWTFRAISLERPQLNILIDRDGIVNLVKLIPVKDPAEEVPQEPETAGPPPRMVFPKIKIVEGEIDITDLRQSTPATVRILPLNLELEEISTLQDREGPYSLVATTADEETFHWTGHITLHPFRSKGSLSFSNIKVDTLWAFIRDHVNLKRPDGLLHFKTGYTLDLGQAEPLVKLEELGLRIEDLNLMLRDAQEPFFELSLAELSNTRFDLGARQLTVGGLDFKNGQVKIDIDATKAINLTKILRSEAEDLEKKQDADAAPVTSTVSEPETAFHIQVEAIGLENLAVAFRDNSRTPAAIAGIRDIDLDVQLNVQTGGEHLALFAQQLMVSISDIQIGAADADVPGIQIAALMANGGAFDLEKRDLTFKRIHLDDGEIDLVREENGQINLIELFASPQAGTVKRQVEARVEEKGALTYSIDTVELTRFETHLSDFTVKKEGPVLNLDNMQVKLTKVDGKSPMGVDINLDIRQGGRVRLEGSVKPKDPSIDSRIAVEAIDLRMLQPYIDPHLAILLRSGFFSSQGQLRYGIPDATSKIAYKGGFGLGKLRITEQQSEETLLGWDSLKTSQLKLRLAPGALEIGDMMLSKLAGKFIIYEDGTLNASRIVKTAGPDAQDSEPAAPDDQADQTLFPITIQQLRFEDGGLFFADLTLSPQFGTRIHNLDGFVTGMSSAPGQRAQVKLEGRVADYGTTTIGGEIDIFNPKGFTDIRVDFSNLEMADLTPYSGKFAGRRIESGKLSLDLAYKVENSQLLGDNQIIVDQLLLGDTVDSNWAVKLPLDLAIAILEDANGVIDIGLPVKGSLEDPKFSIGQLVWKALKNLLTKVITAPFRALGALLGGEEENLETVAFEPGQNEIPPPEIEKLHKLIKALEQRPQLQLIVQGRYSSDADGHYLKDLAVRRRLTAALNIEVAPGEDPGPVAFGDPKVQEQLMVLFREAFGEQALSELMTSLAPPPPPKKDAKAKPVVQVDPGKISKALFERLVANEPVEEVVLQQLADARSQAIKTEMTMEGALPVARVATKPSGLLKAGEPITAMLELGVMGKTQ